MGQDFEVAVGEVAALADPVRRRLYLHVVERGDDVTREQAAQGCGVPLHSAKFHLDKLVEHGLLSVDYRRVSGRTGPGAGRPSKVYRRAAREIAVSLPERSYDLAAELLARAVEEASRSGVAVAEAVAAVARRHGRALGAEAGGSEAGGSAGVADGRERELDLVGSVLREQGYEPSRVDDPAPERPERPERQAELVLRNCPFDRLARDHLELVCGMNLALVDGVVDGLGCSRVHAELDPAPDLCCVRVR